MITNLSPKSFLISSLAFYVSTVSCNAQTQNEIQKAVDDAITKATSEIIEEMKQEVKESEKRKNGDVNALMNDIYLQLNDFCDDFGTFPAESVLNDSEEISGKIGHLAKNSSNRYLGMLLAMGYAGAAQEGLFSPPFAAVNVTKADQNIIAEKLLEAGECSFTYNLGLSLDSLGSTPLLLFPLLPGQQKFDVKAADGKAYVLHVDGTVTSYQIAEDGTVTVNGKSFFDLTQPFWGGKMNLCYPLLKKRE
jgi:hypothetical protein